MHRLIAFLICCSLGGGALASLAWKCSSPVAAPVDAAGFDLAEVRDAAQPSGSPPAQARPTTAPSSLMMIMPEPVHAGASAAKLPSGALNEAARRSGAGISAFTARFRQSHPILLQYRREWMRHPDLKKLNDDYLRDRDLSRFISGLTAAPSFPPLVKAIAADAKSHALALEFVAGAVREVPPDLMSAAADAINDDRTLERLIGAVASAMGLPPGLLPAGLSQPLSQATLRTWRPSSQRPCAQRKC